ncbi:MAG TPA: radical SAM protein [Jatrophihabitans sp.]|jgi:DNA repair photolyase|nr:radical SAM protein [Jatrophihabitans sp.]
MSDFRWKVAEGGEPALFGMDDLLIPERGPGRMSDLEFLHVTAKRILNHVPAPSRAPANWTINVYRGCSHACSYCLRGDTRISMSDGGTKPIADIRPGDRVHGTVRCGDHRHQTTTEILDHWQTVQRAYRVALADGTALVASGDHRFLTVRGWKYVSRGRNQRAYLNANDLIAGLSNSVRYCPHRRGHHRTYVGSTSRRVVAIDDLGVDMPMYDITTGTGDFIADGVVSHNCFARPTHEYLGFNIGDDFDRKIVVKINAVEKLRAELADPAWRHELVAMGTNTDPYQRAEAKYRLTRGILEVLAEHANPFSILTKSPLVTRDLDILVAAAEHADVTVNFSIATLDERVWRATEPGAPHPRRRVEAMARLAAAGIRTGALMMPILPGLSDRPTQLRETVAAIREAGARLLGIGPLHLRRGVREHFLGWLAEHDPALHADYVRRYANGAYAPARYTDELYARAGVARNGTRR